MRSPMDRWSSSDSAGGKGKTSGEAGGSGDGGFSETGAEGASTTSAACVLYFFSTCDRVNGTLFEGRSYRRTFFQKFHNSHRFFRDFLVFQIFLIFSPTM